MQSSTRASLASRPWSLVCRHYMQHQHQHQQSHGHSHGGVPCNHSHSPPAIPAARHETHSTAAVTATATTATRPPLNAHAHAAPTTPSDAARAPSASAIPIPIPIPIASASPSSRESPGPARASAASPPAPSGAVNDKDYCTSLVKKYDYEHYLALLFLPAPVRDAVFAFRALNIEVSQVRDSVSNKTIGQMRIKWWKDAVASAMKGNPPALPIARAIATAAQQHKLTSRWLSRLIEEREKMLDDKPFRTLEEVELYGESTSSALLYLTLESMNIRNLHSDHAASHVGKAEAIVTMLRAVPFNARNKRVYLPMELTAKHGVTQESLIRGETSKELQEVAYDLASAAHVHIQTARAMMADLPPGTSKALLPAVSCNAFLEKIQQKNFNLFDPELHQRNGLLPFSLLKHAFKKTF